ncbi:hypothetical protein O3P69_002114 [Scylla paramamosain]|uniref:Uncharacterized protein n=1 Tax=Scylla paramamosain TaxID=85552 RepID=A0AAW0V6Z3_SCYPA
MALLTPTFLPACLESTEVSCCRTRLTHLHPHQQGLSEEAELAGAQQSPRHHEGLRTKTTKGAATGYVPTNQDYPMLTTHRFWVPKVHAEGDTCSSQAAHQPSQL